MEFKPRKLFESFELISNYQDKREYISSELVSLAEKGELYVSEIMYQRTMDIVDMAGDVIRGMGYEENKLKNDFFVPPELAEYMVKLKPINGKTNVRYKIGFEKTSQMRRRGGKVDKLSPRYKEIEPNANGVVVMQLKDAWLALRQHGKYVSNGNPKRKERQDREWWYEEIPPKIEKVEKTVKKYKR